MSLGSLTRILSGLFENIIPYRYRYTMLEWPDTSIAIKNRTDLQRSKRFTHFLPMNKVPFIHLLVCLQVFVFQAAVANVLDDAYDDIDDNILDTAYYDYGDDDVVDDAPYYAYDKNLFDDAYYDCDDDNLLDFTGNLKDNNCTDCHEEPHPCETNCTHTSGCNPGMYVQI